MKWIWLISFVVMVNAVQAQSPAQVWSVWFPVAEAQTVPLVGNYDVNSLIWDWSPGPSGNEPIKTFVRCGVARGGPYNVIPQQEVLMPLQEIRFNKMAPRPGKYFCLLVGWNTTGEGPSSDEIPLDLKGSVPPKPINARVK